MVFAEAGFGIDLQRFVQLGVLARVVGFQAGEHRMAALLKQRLVLHTVEHDVKRIVREEEHAAGVRQSPRKGHGLQRLLIVNVELRRFVEQIAHADEDLPVGREGLNGRARLLRERARIIHADECDDRVFLIHARRGRQDLRDARHQHVVKIFVAPEIARFEHDRAHIRREGQLGGVDALDRLLLAGAIDDVAEHALVHVEAVGAVAAAAEQGGVQIFGQQVHQLVAEPRELPGVIAHEHVADDLIVGNDADDLDVHLQPVAEQHERVGRHVHLMLDPVREDVLDQVVIQIADLDAVDPVRVVDPERLGIGQHLAGNVDGQQL